MSRLLTTRRAVVWSILGIVAVGVSAAGLNCPATGDPGANPIVPQGNRPPRIYITSITTDFGNNFAEVGETVMIGFSAEDDEDAAVARIFASQSGDPTPQQEIPILGGFPVGPGTANGVAFWDTMGVAPGSYNIFGEIDDRTLDPFTGTGNPPVRVISAQPVQIGPPGSRPSTSPSQLVFLSPLVNLGMSAGDELALSYIFADVDSAATVTLVLDKDLNSTNDNINNPGDPNDPNTNIIILPSFPREPTDPTFDGDPPPPDDPNDPPVQPDSLEIRTNPRTLPQTTPGVLPFPGAPLAGEVKTYIFRIDFSQIPPRTQPYFIRATITDGDNTRHVYAIGSLTISSSAAGVVDAGLVGTGVAGARFRGFSARENLGTGFLSLGDLDLDGVGDFMIASRYGSPRNRPESGAAYLVFGRRKTPFPPDTDGDGLPNSLVPDQDGEFPNFDPPPEHFGNLGGNFLFNPYLPVNVGRFGGTNSINSIGTFFRGAVYTMPQPNGPTLPPITVDDPDPLYQGIRPTSGLMSIAHVDMNRDGVSDFVFGIPFISSAKDFVDLDPVDGGCDIGFYEDGDLPIACDEEANDDLFVPGMMSPLVDQGIVIAVDATNNLPNQFGRFVDAGVTGQFDPDPEKPTDDEGVIRTDDQVPSGMRFRGAWFDSNEPTTGVPSVSEFGHTVSSLLDISNDGFPELMISMPGRGPKGAVQVWLSGDYFGESHYGTDNVRSLPGFRTATDDPGECTEETAMGAMDTECRREWVVPPISTFIIGEQVGDRMGYAASGGDINHDGIPDVLCGAPAASRGGLTECGVVYILYVNVAGFGGIDLALNPPPHVKIIGDQDFARFGAVQTGVEDMNGGGNADMAFASESYNNGAGYVGVIFGSPGLIGPNGFAPSQVGTPALPGVRFLGVSDGARAGSHIASAGDFNGDGFGDLLIASPGEVRCAHTNGTFSMPVGGVCAVGTTPRQGVAYLIFGGPHLDPAVNGSSNNVFNLSQVGTPQLPGIVFVSRRIVGTGPDQTDAPIFFVGGVGDIDGDGFDDIALGAPTADFINPNAPTQRDPSAGEVYLIYGNNFGPNKLTP